MVGHVIIILLVLWARGPNAVYGEVFINSSREVHFMFSEQRFQEFFQCLCIGATQQCQAHYDENFNVTLITNGSLPSYKNDTSRIYTCRSVREESLLLCDRLYYEPPRVCDRVIDNLYYVYLKSSFMCAANCVGLFFMNSREKIEGHDSNLSFCDFACTTQVPTNVTSHSGTTVTTNSTSGFQTAVPATSTSASSLTLLTNSTSGSGITLLTNSRTLGMPMPASALYDSEIYESVASYLSTDTATDIPTESYLFSLSSSSIYFAFSSEIRQTDTPSGLPDILTPTLTLTSHYLTDTASHNSYIAFVTDSSMTWDSLSHLSSEITPSPVQDISTVSVSREIFTATSSSHNSTIFLHPQTWFITDTNLSTLSAIFHSKDSSQPILNLKTEASTITTTNRFLQNESSTNPTNEINMESTTTQFLQNSSTALESSNQKPEESSNTTQISIIIGAIVGGIVLVLIISVVVAVLICKRRKRANNYTKVTYDMFLNKLPHVVPIPYIISGPHDNASEHKTRTTGASKPEVNNAGTEDNNECEIIIVDNAIYGSNDSHSCVRSSSDARAEVTDVHISKEMKSYELLTETSADENVSDISAPPRENRKEKHSYEELVTPF